MTQRKTQRKSDHVNKQSDFTAAGKSFVDDGQIRVNKKRQWRMFDLIEFRNGTFMDLLNFFRKR
jgi:hypothetical protein